MINFGAFLKYNGKVFTKILAVEWDIYCKTTHYSQPTQWLKLEFFTCIKYKFCDKVSRDAQIGFRILAQIPIPTDPKKDIEAPQSALLRSKG